MVKSYYYVAHFLREESTLNYKSHLSVSIFAYANLSYQFIILKGLFSGLTSFKISLHITWGVQDRNRSLKVRPPVLEEWVIEEVITDINYSHI